MGNHAICKLFTKPHTLAANQSLTITHVCIELTKHMRGIRKIFVKFGGESLMYIASQTMEDVLSEPPRCNDMVADLHFSRFFGTPKSPIQCEIARRFPRSEVKVGLNVLCKNVCILSGVQPWTSTDLKLSYFNT